MLSRWAIVLTLLLVTVWADEERRRDKPSKKTMKKLCEMPEFQQAMAADAELEPAAVVYDVMTKRLSALESHIQQLEKRLEDTPTQEDIDAVAASLREELLTHVDERINVIQTEIEENVQKILKELMDNLASLGYEKGFQLESQVTTTLPTTTTEPPLIDCDYLASKDYSSGVHALNINGVKMEAYCEIKEDETAWLVIQRRIDNNVDFYRGWDDYSKGFGDLMGSFYLGNSYIHNLTTDREHVLRVEMTDGFGEGYAEYSNFSISSAEDGYRLSYGHYIRGSAGDSLRKSRGMKFSTFDNDNDGSRLYSCSRLHHGAFWYDRCGSANLNGVYLGQSGSVSSYNWQNIFWYAWRRDLRALTEVKMLIRPRIVKAVMVL